MDTTYLPPMHSTIITLDSVRKLIVLLHRQKLPRVMEFVECLYSAIDLEADVSCEMSLMLCVVTVVLRNQ